MVYWRDSKDSKYIVDLCDFNTSMNQCCIKRHTNISYTVVNWRNTEQEAHGPHCSPENPGGEDFVKS